MDDHLENNITVITVPMRLVCLLRHGTIKKTAGEATRLERRNHIEIRPVGSRQCRCESQQTEATLGAASKGEG